MHVPVGAGTRPPQAGLLSLMLGRGSVRGGRRVRARRSRRGVSTRPRFGDDPQVPINIPALAATARVEYDLNKELRLHGYANLASGFMGGLPNYLGYCNSVMYGRCGGGGKAAGSALLVVEALSIAYGMRVVPYVPRALAGCLILHVGLDLVREAVVDSRAALDGVEYAVVVCIAGVMTVWGFSAGLLFALAASGLTFTARRPSGIEAKSFSPRRKTPASSSRKDVETAAPPRARAAG